MSPYINASGIGIYHLIFNANGTNAIRCEFNGTNILNATHSGFGMSSVNGIRNEYY
jgi:hypothetical protein